MVLVERFPQRFGLPGHHWLSNACILAMAGYDRVDRVVTCGAIRRRCNLRKTCPYCSWQWVRKAFLAFHGLLLQDIWFTTVSPTQPLVCTEPLFDDPAQVWNAVHDAVMSFVKAGRLSGAIIVEEWAPVDFFAETGLPHIHGLLHCHHEPEWQALVEDINTRLLAHGTVQVDSKTFQVLGPAHLYNFIHYLVKPVDWSKAYVRGWPNAEDKELFNAAVQDHIEAWDYHASDHRGITQLGTLNSNHKPFAGVKVKHRHSKENLNATHEWLDSVMEEGFNEFPMSLEDAARMALSPNPAVVNAPSARRKSSSGPLQPTNLPPPPTFVEEWER